MKLKEKLKKRRETEKKLGIDSDLLKICLSFLLNAEKSSDEEVKSDCIKVCKTMIFRLIMEEKFKEEEIKNGKKRNGCESV